MLISINCKFVSDIIGKPIISNFINGQIEYVGASLFNIRKKVGNPGALLNLWIGVVKVFDRTLIISFGHVSVGDRSNKQSGAITGVILKFYLGNLTFLNHVKTIFCIADSIYSFVVKIGTEN
jgi:hypothetical protein